MLNFNINRKKTLFLVSIYILCLLFAYKLIGRNIWMDEAFSGILIKMPLDQFFHHIVNDVHPPLYYILLKIYTFVFSASDMALRVFSLIFHFISIFFVFFLTEKFSAKVRYTATAFFALNPFFLHFATEIRMYSMFACFVIISAFFLQRALNGKMQFTKNYLYFSIFAALAFLTHYFAVFYIFSSFIFFLYYFKFYLKENVLNKKFFIFLLKVFSIPAIAILLWLPFFIYQINHDPGISWIPPVDFLVLRRTIPAFLFGIKTFGGGIVMVNAFYSDLFFLDKKIDLFPQSIYLLVFIAIALIFLSKKIYKKPLLVFLKINAFLPILILILLSILFDLNYYMERYLIAFAAFFVIFFTWIIYRLLPRFLAFCIFFYYFLLIVFFNASVNLENDFLELDQYMNENYKQQKIVFAQYKEYMSARFYREDKWENGNLKYINYRRPDANLANWQYIASDDTFFSYDDLNSDDWIIFKDDNYARRDELILIETVGDYKIYKLK